MCTCVRACVRMRMRNILCSTQDAVQDTVRHVVQHIVQHTVITDNRCLDAYGRCSHTERAAEGDGGGRQTQADPKPCTKSNLAEFVEFVKTCGQIDYSTNRLFE